MKLLEFSTYTPKNEQEQMDLDAINSFLNNNEDALLRTNKIAHVTSSAFVVNPTLDKVLFIHHNIYNSWGWVGGHNDGNPNLLDVAIQEAKEETGLAEVTPHTKNVIAVDILNVTNHIKHGSYVSDHLHLNACFLLIADEHAPITHKEDENSGVRWFDLDRCIEHCSEERMKPTYQKIINTIKSLRK